MNQRAALPDYLMLLARKRAYTEVHTSRSLLSSRGLATLPSISTLPSSQQRPEATLEHAGQAGRRPRYPDTA